MANAPNPDATPTAKRGKGLLFGLVGAVLLGGAGFYATFSGLISLSPATTDSHVAAPATVEDITFYPLDPMVVSLGAGANARHLRFTATLELAPGATAAVHMVMPRILDVLTTFLHAVSEEELVAPAAITRLRAQILRRVQVVAGAENIRDVLITEFVLG